MNQIQKAELEKAQAMRDREFTFDGNRHRIVDAYFTDLDGEVVIEVRVWTRPECSHSELLGLRELETRMRQNEER